MAAHPLSPWLHDDRYAAYSVDFQAIIDGRMDIDSLLRIADDGCPFRVCTLELFIRRRDVVGVTAALASGASVSQMMMFRALYYNYNVCEEIMVQLVRAVPKMYPPDIPLLLVVSDRDRNRRLYSDDLVSAAVSKLDANITFDSLLCYARHEDHIDRLVHMGASVNAAVSSCGQSVFSLNCWCFTSVLWLRYGGRPNDQDLKYMRIKHMNDRLNLVEQLSRGDHPVQRRRALMEQWLLAWSGRFPPEIARLCGEFIHV